MNKADRRESILRLSSGETERELLDLFDALDVDGEHMEYRMVYASAMGGWCTEDLDVELDIAARIEGDGDNGRRKDEERTKKELGIDHVLEAIPDDVPPPMVYSYDFPTIDVEESEQHEHENDSQYYASHTFSMTATMVGYDPYLGQTCTVRIYSGSVTNGDSVSVSCFYQ